MTKLRSLSAILHKRRGRKAHSASAVPTWAYATLDDAPTSEYFETATNLPAPWKGSTTMTVAYIYRVRALPSANSSFPYVIDGRGSGGGWLVYSYAAGNWIRWDITDSVGLKESPVYTHVAGDVGKVICSLATYDGSTLRHYINGAEQGSGTAASGYASFASNTQSLTLGGQGGGFSLLGDWHEPVGIVMASDVTLSASQVSAYQTTLESALDVVVFPAGTCGIYKASDWPGDPSGWPDDTATEDLVPYNNPTGPTPFTPNWK